MAAVPCEIKISLENTLICACSPSTELNLFNCVLTKGMFVCQSNLKRRCDTADGQLPSSILSI